MVPMSMVMWDGNAMTATRQAADLASPVGEQVAAHARVVGLGEFSTPSLEAVERRRSELWTTAILMMIGLAVGMALLTLQSAHDALVRMPAFRVGVVVLSAALATYVLEKERHLRRLTALLMDERVLTAALSNRLKELAALLEVGKAVNSTLDLETVLGVILSSAIDLLQAGSGSIMLVEPPDRLRVLCQQGNEGASGASVRIGQGIAGQVAARREPMLITGNVGRDEVPDAVRRELPVSSAISVPLINRDELLGVLNVNGNDDRAFTEYDLRALTLFAEHAAMSIANARLYEAERNHVAELVALDKMKSEFVATVSHELRTPLTSILGCSRTLQQRTMAPDVSAEFLRMIERQGKRLLGLIEDVLDLERLGRHQLVRERVDLSSALREVVRVQEAAGRAVSLEATPNLPVLGDRGGIERIFTNLIDNATTHGGGNVEIVASASMEGTTRVARVSVLDRGPGVDPKDADSIFDRFKRGSDAFSRPGMGLGLHLVRSLVESHEGTVWVEARDGGGAAFHVVLPLHTH